LGDNLGLAVARPSVPARIQCNIKCSTLSKAKGGAPSLGDFNPRQSILKGMSGALIVRCGGLFCGWGGLVEKGAGVGYEFGETMGQGEDAFGLPEADGVFGD